MPTSSSQYNYNHRITFKANSGKNAEPVTAVFEISAATKFIPWKFKGEDIPDNIKFTLSGSAYSVPIGLDYYVIGSQLPDSRFQPNVFPKSASTYQYSFFQKIMCLTGLTINNGDKIIIEVTPKTNDTNWELYWGCLDNWNGVSPMHTAKYKVHTPSIVTTSVELSGTVIGVSNSTDPTKTKLTTNTPHNINSITAYTEFPIQLSINNIASGYNYYNGKYVISDSDVVDNNNFLIDKTPNSSFIGVNNNGLLRFSGASCSNVFTVQLTGASLEDYTNSNWTYLDDLTQFINNIGTYWVKPIWSGRNKARNINYNGLALPLFQYQQGGNSRLFFTSKFCNNDSGYCDSQSNCNSIGCTTSSSKITYRAEKVGNINVFGITSNTASDISVIYNALMNYKNNFWNPPGTYGGINVPSSTNPENIGYYRFLAFVTPRRDSADNCGDNFIENYQWFHLSSTIQSGITSGNYWIKITPPLLDDRDSTVNKTSEFCDIRCRDIVKQAISTCNGTATGSTTNFDFVSNNGLRTNIPTNYAKIPTTGLTTQLSAVTGSGFIEVNDFQFTTYPFSGVSNTLIPSLSGRAACLLSSDSTVSSTKGYTTNKYWTHQFLFTLTNPNNVADYDIYASPITNGLYSGWPGSPIYKKVYSYVNGVGTILDGNYVA
jgi:hypothetical protein